MEFDAEDVALFMDNYTTLEVIKKAGWTVEESSSGEWYFRKGGKTFRPVWVAQIELRGEQVGATRIRNMVRDALGIERMDQT